jgi:UDP-N-acetylmuramoyl-L-alanyl-D-glutamate--2,6-diaminopimelate ligase
MRFSELMRRAGATHVVLAGDPEVRRVIQDSREAQPGDLFVAVRGLTVDGHSFLRDVVRAGACAAVVEDAALLPADTPHAVVADARIALAKVAAQLLGEPTRALTLVGITGTNGKTTTTYLVEAIAAEAGLSAGVIGTVGYRYAGRTLPSPHTTPDPVALQRLFADMRDAGVRVVAMETSSHALEQRRVEGCDFSIAAFSNLTQDHLDYHGSMDAYFEAKARFFTELLPASTASAKASVINLDDPRGNRPSRT